jgi:hypothetical protein
MGGWLVWELAICLVFTWAVPRQRKGFSRPIWSAPVSSPASSGPASSRAVCSPHPTGGTTERPGSPACWSRTANFGQSAIGRPWSPAWIRAPWPAYRRRPDWPRQRSSLSGRGRSVPLHRRALDSVSGAGLWTGRGASPVGRHRLARRTSRSGGGVIGRSCPTMRPPVNVPEQTANR